MPLSLRLVAIKKLRKHAAGSNDRLSLDVVPARDRALFYGLAQAELASSVLSGPHPTYQRLWLTSLVAAIRATAGEGIPRRAESDLGADCETDAAMPISDDEAPVELKDIHHAGSVGKLTRSGRTPSYAGALALNSLAAASG